ncbi:NYN domain-containing protein [Alsobacter sp. SYSU M60028]|uniref:NYN domain-containing protein n=1 Tax=Alsobacter ponti TaxID=2962936 RepID=A0ABT1L8K2_9HYPH|nr:NYN domain-containing protein [Alsobacter ponti]
MRGAVYYDGFNLYHAIDDLNAPHLKWCNLWKLGELICRGHARTLGKAVFCSAYFPGDHGKKIRHERYVEALTLTGVETILGHTTREPQQCPKPDCSHVWDIVREKATDINLALAIFAGAMDDLYDIAFVVTADTDQVATFQAIRARFPAKKLFSVTPPARHPSKHLRDLADGVVRLNDDHIDQCVLPGLVQREGKRSVMRPKEYDPPPGWVHPDHRRR